MAPTSTAVPIREAIVAARLTRADVKRLDRLAHQRGVRRSDLVRAALERVLAEEGAA